MQSLRDYLNHTQQYESILNPDQNQVMSRMTDDMIRQRIREYCTYKLRRYKGEQWIAADPRLTITEIDKDEKGWYVDTNSAVTIYLMFGSGDKSFYDYCSSCGQKIDKQKGFLIEDMGVYFRWRKHKGSHEIIDALNLESTEGLPEELDMLYLTRACEKSKRLDICTKIKVIGIYSNCEVSISGKGCKNVIINPDSQTNITTPSRIKIRQTKTKVEYWDLMKKLAKL